MYVCHTGIHASVGVVRVLLLHPVDVNLRQRLLAGELAHQPVVQVIIMLVDSHTRQNALQVASSPAVEERGMTGAAEG